MVILVEFILVMIFIHLCIVFITYSISLNLIGKGTKMNPTAIRRKGVGVALCYHCPIAYVSSFY